jgi:FlaA1/EpsC-like NDP-sugar epimerase
VQVVSIKDQTPQMMLLTRLNAFSRSSRKLLALRLRHLSSCASGHEAVNGKKCVITGASRGIGLAIARRFACEGADTVLVGRDKNTLQKAVEQVNSESKGRGSHVARIGDVAQRQFWEDLQGELVSDTHTYTHHGILKVYSCNDIY